MEATKLGSVDNVGRVVNFSYFDFWSFFRFVRIHSLTLEGIKGCLQVKVFHLILVFVILRRLFPRSPFLQGLDIPLQKPWVANRPARLFSSV